MLKWFLQSILNIEIEDLVIKNKEQKNKKYHIKNKTLDVLVSTKKEMINIELNSGFYPSLHIRNMAYICNSYASEINKGEDYSKMRNHIQINFTWGLKEDYPLKAMYEILDEKHKIRYVNNFKIIEYNMEKLIKLWYSGNREVLKYKEIIMLGLEKDDLNKICKGDDMMEKFKDNVENLNEDDEMEFLLTEEEDYEKLKNTLISEAKTEGLSQGISQGISKRNLEIAENMLKLKLNINDIIKVTGLSKNEILALKNN